MDDDTCKECYDCKSVFTAWRRKHHCRICGKGVSSNSLSAILTIRVGLIYCSRCASNIINGSRFGQEGMVRVCNLCLDQISKVDEDDDDDRRSVASSAVTSSFPVGPDALSISYGTKKRYQPHSPFAASQLFGRGEEPYSLFSIAEARRAMSYGSDDSALNSLATTPEDEVGPDALGVPVRAAPFRRAALAEDEKESGVTVIEPDQPPPDGDSPARARSPVEFPKTITIPQDGMSSIQFPVSSPDQSFAVDGPFSGGLERSRYNSLADMDSLPTPFIRSRVQSRLMDSVSTAEPGWRTRRESIA
jgi:1-phosphatidylinositol-3-phosphate 5-kinase